MSLRSTWLIPALAACANLALVAGVDAATAQTNAPKKPSYRSQRQSMFALSQIDFATVVMLGDSLTEGAPWSEITGCRYLANRGIGGDDTAGLLKRLDGVTVLKPAAVILMIGVNDVASAVSTGDIVDNVREVVDRLTKSGARVYLTLVLPVAQSFKKINPKIDELNTAYLKLAKDAGLTVIDFRADMRNEDGFLREEFSRDGIHLTAEGYRVWRDTVLPTVMAHCDPKAVPSLVPRAQPQAAPARPMTPAPAPAHATTPAAAPTGEFNTRFGPFR